MKFLCSALFITISFFCAAQEKLVKFGKVPLHEVKMAHYEKDSMAHGVVLYDRGHFNADDFRFTRHVRIKVFTPAGTSFGNFVVRTPVKSNIKGYTNNLENGQMVTTKLENSNIYNEEIVDGFQIYKLFFPDVKPGSVIDLEYSHAGLPSEWRFQDRIPVVHSELILQRPDYISFKKVFYGFEAVKEISSNHWIAEDVPALREETYMSHYSNYLTRFQFDIETISIPRFSFYKEYTTSWEKVGERLMEMEYFGGVIRGCAFLNDKASELEQSKLSTAEKVVEAMRYIRENLKWNNVPTLMASAAYRENFKKNHTGNAAEINLLLIGLLKKSGITVYPVVLSTRDNGLLNPLSASLSKLNYVVAYVNHDGVAMLLDATSPYTTPGILPDRCLNVSGWVVEATGGGSWIDLNPGKANVLRQFVKITPNEASGLNAEVISSYEGYAFLDWIEKYEKKGRIRPMQIISGRRLRM